MGFIELRAAAQQALEILERLQGGCTDSDVGTVEAITVWCPEIIDDLRAALAEPEGGGNLPPPLQKPGDFDHAIGADRFKVVRGAFWWHVLIGDSPTKHGKFHSRASAEKMAADLLREFRNGAFVQHEAALAEPTTEGFPAVEPVAWMHTDAYNPKNRYLEWSENRRGYLGDWIKTPLYAAPLKRTPLTEEEIQQCFKEAGIAIKGQHWTNAVRAIERAHGIGGQP